MNIKNITIIGSGTLGSRIGLQAAISGYQVIFYDISEPILDQAKIVMDKIMRQATHQRQPAHGRNKISSPFADELHDRF